MGYDYEPDSDNVNAPFVNNFQVNNHISTELVDQWDRIKIPLLLPEAIINQAPKWYEFKDSHQRSYSALSGVSILELPTGNRTFYLETSYIDLECEAPEMSKSDVSSTSYPNEGEVNTKALDSFPKNPLPPNGAWYAYQPEIKEYDADSNQLILALDRFIDPLWLNKNDAGFLGFREF